MSKKKTISFLLAFLINGFYRNNYLLSNKNVQHQCWENLFSEFSNYQFVNVLIGRKFSFLKLVFFRIAPVLSRFHLNNYS